MSYRDWKVGDRVVCVNATWGGGRQAIRGIPCPLVEKAIYTIASFSAYNGVGFDGRAAKMPVVILVECRHPGRADGFDARRFRKVEPRKTDISCFQNILRDVFAKEDA